MLYSHKPHHTFTSACRRPDKYGQQPCNLLRTLVGLSQSPTRSFLLVCSCELKPQHPLVLYQVSRECGTFFKRQAEHEMRQYGVCCQLLMLIIHLHKVTTMRHTHTHARPRTHTHAHAHTDTQSFCSYTCTDIASVHDKDALI